MAGDTTPIDVISHFPIYCEQNKLQYVWVDSTAELGRSMSSSKPVAVCLILAPAEGDEHAEYFGKVVKQITKLKSE